MEYLSFGPLLERSRFAQLDHLGNPLRALVLGDGDGRFLARLLDRYPALHADMIDASPAMISVARQRAEHYGARAEFQVADIRSVTIDASKPYDLVTAHFFLDCLTDAEVDSLVQRIALNMTGGAIFLVSEFSIPAKQPLRVLSQLLVGSLYTAFRFLTGLETRRLPDYASTLLRAGFLCEDTRLFLGGILRSERWRYRG